ncbi:MAG: histidine kinase [Caldilineaceae bacterium]
MQLEGAQRLISQNPERARTMVATVREEIVDGLRELRQTVARLRTPLEADLRLALRNSLSVMLPQPRYQHRVPGWSRRIRL